MAHSGPHLRTVDAQANRREWPSIGWLISRYAACYAECDVTKTAGRANHYRALAPQYLSCGNRVSVVCRPGPSRSPSAAVWSGSLRPCHSRNNLIDGATVAIRSWPISNKAQVSGKLPLMPTREPNAPLSFSPAMSFNGPSVGADGIDSFSYVLATVAMARRRRDLPQGLR